MPQDLAIGIDLGGTQARVALVLGGEVVRRSTERTDVAGGPAAVLRQFKTMIGEICSEDERRALRAVGICAPGPLDTETGTVLHIPTLPGWEDFPLRDVLRSELGLPVLVENDAIAAVYGEWKFGAGRGLRHLVFVTVSTGIGGGAVVDGRLLHGRRGMAAHIGHVRMAPEGPRCSCGATACFEAFAAGTALARRAREESLNPGGFLAEVASERAVETKDIVTGAREGDDACLALLAQEAEYLGRGFTGLIHLFSPDRVIMGGGVSNAFDLMSDRIHAVIRRDAMQPFKDVPVVRAELGDNAGLVGAASLALCQDGPDDLERRD
jgi:glucokinase